jgi:outer membrane protein TolC
MPKMKQMLWCAVLCLCSLPTDLAAQAQSRRRGLDFYLREAVQHSPLQRDGGNQTALLDVERQRLKNVYMHAQTLLTGSCLFVPVVSTEGGAAAFEWNAQSGTDYWGYDLGLSSGNMQAGLTWTQPLLGGSVYRAAEREVDVRRDVLANSLRLDRHDLERTVTDQYLLCLLDGQQAALSDSTALLLSTQADFIGKLALAGQARQVDAQMLQIERAANAEAKAAALQSLRGHLMELNVLCGIADTAFVNLEPASLTARGTAVQPSQWMAKYDLDSLGVLAAQRMYETNYLPRLHFFAGCGLQTTSYSAMYRHVGMSAGLTFSLLLSDGHQRQLRRRQTEATLASIAVYREHLAEQNTVRLRQCVAAIADCDGRLRLLDSRLAAYDRLLLLCRKEIGAGQMSVFDYLTTLRNMVAARQQRLTVAANRQLALNAYNYYCW